MADYAPLLTLSGDELKVRIIQCEEFRGALEKHLQLALGHEKGEVRGRAVEWLAAGFIPSEAMQAQSAGFGGEVLGLRRGG